MFPNNLDVFQEVKDVEKFWRNLFDFANKTPDSPVSKKLDLIKLQFRLFFGSPF